MKQHPGGETVSRVFALIALAMLACGAKDSSSLNDNVPMLGTLSHAQLVSRHGGYTAGEWSGCVRTGNCGEVTTPRDAAGATHMYWSNWWSIWIWTNDADAVVRVCVPDAPEETYAAARDRFWRARSAVAVALGTDVLNRMIAEYFYEERRVAQEVDTSEAAIALRIWTEPTGKFPGLKFEGGSTTCWEMLRSQSRTKSRH